MADPLPERPEPPIRIAISECLLGREVRYDGSESRSSFPHSLLDGLFEYQGICPEVGIGMSVPRKPIRLVADRVEAVHEPAQDYAPALTDFGVSTARRISDVAGYVFMKNSPSCGLYKVKVYPEDGGMPRRGGRGVHAAAVVEALPDLPVEENGRLNDPVLRENFVTRVFAFAHWHACFGTDYATSGRLSASGLLAFHSRYKYLLMAHSVPHYQQTGRLLSDLKGDLVAKAGEYRRALMAGLSKPASPGGHANVMSHLQGYLKKRIGAESRREIAELIAAYQRGEQPLMAPLALLGHHLRRYPDEYVLQQTYLDPHPGFPGMRRWL